MEDDEPQTPEQDQGTAPTAIQLQSLPEEVAIDDSLFNFDLGNLAVFDPSPIDLAEFKSEGESYLTSTARERVQALFNRVFNLPTKRLEVDVLAVFTKTFHFNSKRKTGPNSSREDQMGDVCRKERNPKDKEIEKDMGRNAPGMATNLGLQSCR
eukprot:TRINITY_DN2985_c0_g1_i1.p1 TRINITY_DN2985_c0_g1~~TRINITY_DN2985_c0_g1_i1.p1  ORF type:complete len:163 (-),score=58.77 TRINITY_DN2985_c0_g1_i1:194-655(-)